MFRKLAYSFVIILFSPVIYSQSETYTISKTSFSSDKYDEFSPVYYNNGLVFCTDRNVGLSNHSSSEGKGLIKIYYIDTLNGKTWKDARIFSKSLTSVLNDGPVTFTKNRDTVYFSRNQKIANTIGDINSPRNKLGIFYAVLVNGQWSKIRDMRFNSDIYNITTPCLSPDGKKLYFASDKTGGYGGSDIYCSVWKSDRWGDPVNLGPIINTAGNESYPFITSFGELLFSSDGRNGLGGKDIYISRQSDTIWLPPVHLDAPINSKFDDFGIITDSLMNNGYFSSNRDKSIDIYHFTTNVPQIFFSDIQKENQYCYVFKDTESIAVDTMNLKYVWNFGDGVISSGSSIAHCFNGPGIYDVKLDIFDKNTGNLFFSRLAYKLEIKDFKQAYITSPDEALKGNIVYFDAYKSNFPKHKILNYSWEFGDGTREQGPKVQHRYKEKGVYIVNLGLTLKDELTGKILKTGSSKKIRIGNDMAEIASYRTEKNTKISVYPNVMECKNAVLDVIYSSDTDLQLSSIFQVVLASSKTKTDARGDYFKNLPKGFDIEEVFNPATGFYSYIVDEEMDLMSTYLIYSQMIKAGFKTTVIKTKVLTEPAEKDLCNIKKIFGTSTDSYFDSYNRLTSNAFLMLDQIVKIMNKYPDLKLEVDIYTDNSGSIDEKLNISKKIARVISSYLIDKGVPENKFVTRGLGAVKQIALNISESDKSKNRRIDFKIIR